MLKHLKLYKEKYNFSFLPHKGLFGIELRNIPVELSGIEIKINSESIFYVNDNLLLIGSLKEIIEQYIYINY